MVLDKLRSLATLAQGGWTSWTPELALSSKKSTVPKTEETLLTIRLQPQGAVVKMTPPPPLTSKLPINLGVLLPVSHHYPLHTGVLGAVG